MKTHADRNKILMAIMATATVMLLLATVVGLVFFSHRVDSYNGVGIEDYNEYSNLYAFIADEDDSALSDTLYGELAAYGMENDCYIENIGANLVTRYSKQELL